ncbi:MAG: endonuclease V [Aggregatilineales bacterium]
MHINHLHKWDVTPKEAIAIQNEFRGKLENRPLDFDAIQLIAGVDVSVKNNVSQAAVVVMTYPQMEVVETALAKQPTPFPYVPGLLTFREGPALDEAFEKLTNVPDVFLFDGMGRIHPRRMGIAAHLGLWLGKPTIGCGKTHFLGTYDTPALEAGSYTALTDKGEQLGVVLRTRTNVKPVYISPGHLCDIESATRFVLATTSRYRLPHPIRLAHNAAGML